MKNQMLKTLCLVLILFLDIYEKARRKDKKAEDTSCLETTDDDRLKEKTAAPPRINLPMRKGIFLMFQIFPR